MSEEIENIVSEVLEKLPNYLIKKLTNWGKIVQVNINGHEYHINFQENLDLTRGSHPDGSDFTITSSLDTFKNLVQGNINPVDAVVSGDVSIDGSLTTALEFSEIIQSADI